MKSLTLSSSTFSPDTALSSSSAEASLVASSNELRLNNTLSKLQNY